MLSILPDCTFVLKIQKYVQMYVRMKSDISILLDCFIFYFFTDLSHNKNHINQYYGSFNDVYSNH